MRDGLRLAALAMALVFSAPVVARADAEPPAAAPAPERLRAGRTPLASGAEIITIFVSTASGADVPVVSILNDTLGDADEANDQLRYVWVFSYCPPSVRQKILAFIPFYYARASTRTPNPNATPPVVHDFSKYRRSVWRSMALYGAQLALIDPAGWLFKAGSRTYARNEDAYRGAHLENALSVIEAYRERPSSDAFTDPSVDGLFGQLLKRGKVGVFLNRDQLAAVARKRTADSRKNAGRNWELLRQRCEDEGLFFEPLGGTSRLATHAIVWVDAGDIARSDRSREFDGRFLNIASPWSDSGLRGWEGYTKRFFVDPSGRYEAEPTPGAKPVDMIPLAIYGLDFPRIPVLLVDFRSMFNPKSREVSGRAIDDIGKYIVDASLFGDTRLFLLKRMWGMFADRRGIDLNRPTRATAYAQLATLVSLEDALDPELNTIVASALDRLRTNPLQSRWDAERSAVQAQFDALMAAARSGELDRRLERDRHAERLRLAHSGFGLTMRRIASVASFGIYRPRADSTEIRERYALARAMRTHVALLEEVAATPRPIDVVWAPEKYRDALAFLARHGDIAPSKAAESLAAIVRNSGDFETQLLALEALTAMDNEAAHAQLASLGTGVQPPPATLTVRPTAPFPMEASPVAP